MTRSSVLYRRARLILALLALAATGCAGDGGGGTVYRASSPAVVAPSSIIAVSGDKSVEVSWSPVSGASSYSIYRSFTSTVTKSTGSKIASGIIGSLYTDATVTNGTQYYYVITSTNSGIESAISQEVSAVPGTSGTISGRVLYEDRELGSSSFTGAILLKPVRYADVEIVNTATAAVLLSTQTDSRGAYNVAAPVGAASVYVRVNARATPPSATSSVRVVNLANAIYGLPSQAFSRSGSAQVMMTAQSAASSGAVFNILDVMTTGYDFVNVLNGAYPSTSLTTYWAPGNTYGTYYCFGGCPSGNGIYVVSRTGGDTDEYDDDVLWHEFGHFLAATYSVDQSPGGYHSLADNDHDLRFSWSEGWGNFVPGAIKSWLSAYDPSRLSAASGQSASLYVDTAGAGGWSFDWMRRPRSLYSSRKVSAPFLSELVRIV